MLPHVNPTYASPLAEALAEDVLQRVLLGADDKAGVAAIVAAAAYLARHPEVEHGTVKIAFTPDEEVGEGTRHFDIAGFGADVAYTVDASDAGNIEDETFS